MRLRFHPPVIVNAVRLRLAAELPIVPEGQFHCEIGEEQGLAASKTQSGPDIEKAEVPWLLEIRRGVVIAFIGGEVGGSAQQAVERDERAGIEQVIDAQGTFSA